jgi:Zn finger protein HypA/HybF involved in hydrogenase expression
MKIIKNYGFHRRDFWADFECEFCGNIEKNVRCYDDSYFHQQVIPNKECKKCGKKSLEITSGARFDDSVVM